MNQTELKHFLIGSFYIACALAGVVLALYLTNQIFN